MKCLMCQFSHVFAWWDIKVYFGKLSKCTFAIRMSELHMKMYSQYAKRHLQYIRIGIMKDFELQHRPNSIQRNIHFNLQDLRQHQTNNRYSHPTLHKQSPADNQDELEFQQDTPFYEIPVKAVQLKINQADYKVKREEKAGHTVKVQDEVSTRSRKTRQNWTQQKYDKILLQFRNMYLGIPNKGIHQLAEEMGFCVRTIQLKWNEYLQDKSITSIINTLKTTLSKKRSICNKTKFYLELIRQILAQNGLLTSNEIAKAINQKLKHTNTHFHKSELRGCIVGRMLKKDNYSYQRVPYLAKNVPKANLSEKVIKQRRKQYCQLYLSFMQSEAEMIFLDQTDINLYLNRKYCWLQKHQQDLPIAPQGKDNNIAILTTITTITKREGALAWRIFEQPLNKVVFTSTLQEIIKKFIEEGKNDRRKILIMQNSCSEKIQMMSLSLEVKNAVQIFYLPPQSHLYNPVECFFRQLTEHLKSKNWSSKQELIKVTKQILQQKKNLKVQVYFNRVEKYINEGLLQMLKCKM